MHLQNKWVNGLVSKHLEREGGACSSSTGLRQGIAGAVTALSMAGCARLDAIDYTPKLSPEAFLQNQPSLAVKLGDFSFIWCQPSSSVFVFLVALYTIFTGYKFLSRTQGQRSMYWWGIGLLLTGIAAVLAGISYQAFGYEIKCHGRASCTFTSWWEVFYMLLSALGMAAWVLAAAYSNGSDRARKTLVYSACTAAIVYAVLLMYGAFTANLLLVSFEFMALFSICAVVFFLVLHGRAWVRTRDAMNRWLLKTWLIFVAVFLGYVAYQSFGIGGALWKAGIWFTDNDVLHLGMIYWVYVVGKHLPQHLKDRVAA
jgi:hypothetical protein